MNNPILLKYTHYSEFLYTVKELNISDDNEVIQLCFDCKYWSYYIILIRYRILTLFEKYDKDSNKINFALESDYLCNSHSILLENFNLEFIEFILEYKADNSMSFDDELDSLTEKIYRKWILILLILVHSLIIISLFFEPNKISKKTRILIDNCYDNNTTDYKLIIPSIVFVELRRKFLISNEKINKFKYEVFIPTINADKINIREIDIEVMTEFLKFDNYGISFERMDKIVVATALVMNSCVISYDTKIEEYAQKSGKIKILTA